MSEVHRFTSNTRPLRYDTFGEWVSHADYERQKVRADRAEARVAELEAAGKQLAAVRRVVAASLWADLQTLQDADVGHGALKLVENVDAFLLMLRGDDYDQ